MKVKKIGMLYIGRIFLVSTADNFNMMLCEPCNCYPHDGPIFIPSRSNTYMNVSCIRDTFCDSILQNECGENNQCKFTVEYNHGSRSVSGILSTDKLRLFTNRVKTAKKVFTFGCIHQTIGNFPRQTTGLMGLGRNMHSLASQLEVLIFSYCLPTGVRPGWVHFGHAVKDSDPMDVITHLVNPESGLYYVNILSFTVQDGPRIIINPPHDEFLVNTGIPKSQVDPDTMSKLIDSIKAVVSYPVSLRTLDPSLTSIPGYDLCFKVPRTDQVNPKFPSMLVEFGNGGFIHLGSNNLFRMANRGTGTWCFTFRSSNMVGVGESILASEAQMGREIVVKPGVNEISFSKLRKC